MQQINTFFALSENLLQEYANDWLRENEHLVEVLDIQLVFHGGVKGVLIVYEPKTDH